MYVTVFKRQLQKCTKGEPSKCIAFFDRKQDENSSSEGLVEALINIQKMQNGIINKIKA